MAKHANFAFSFYSTFIFSPNADLTQIRTFPNADVPKCGLSVHPCGYNINIRACIHTSVFGLYISVFGFFKTVLISSNIRIIEIIRLHNWKKRSDICCFDICIWENINQYSTVTISVFSTNNVRIW